MQLLEFHSGGCPTRSSAGAVNQAPESRGCQGRGNFADWLEIRGSGFFIPRSPDHRVLLRKSSQLVGGVHASKLKMDQVQFKGNQLVCGVGRVSGGRWSED